MDLIMGLIRAGLTLAALVVIVGFVAALFMVIFFWTPPHFWALAMRFKDDYAAASVPMLPVVATPALVASRIVAYSWAMVATSLLLVAPVGPSGCHSSRSVPMTR